MTKITNIDKTPNDYVKEEQEDYISDDPDHQDYEFINPITNEVESQPRFLVRGRLAQWTHYIDDEIKRLNIVHGKCLEISEHIDNLKEKEANKDG